MCPSQGCLLFSFKFLLQAPNRFKPLEMASDTVHCIYISLICLYACYCVTNIDKMCYLDLCNTEVDFQTCWPKHARGLFRTLSSLCACAGISLWCITFRQPYGGYEQEVQGRLVPRDCASQPRSPCLFQLIRSTRQSVGLPSSPPSGAHLRSRVRHSPSPEKFTAPAAGKVRV